MWIHFLRHYDYVTTSPEQNNIHVQIYNDVFCHCIFSNKLDLIQATSLLVENLSGLFILYKYLYQSFDGKYKVSAKYYN